MIETEEAIKQQIKKSKRVLVFGYFAMFFVILMGIYNFYTGHIILGSLMAVLLPINIYSTLKLKKSIKSLIEFAEGIEQHYGEQEG